MKKIYVVSLLCFSQLFFTDNSFAHGNTFSARNGEYIGCYDFVFENVWSQAYVVWADNDNTGQGSQFNTGVLATNRSWRKACAAAQSALPPTSLHENFVHTYSTYNPETGGLGSCLANVRYIIGHGPWLDTEQDTRLTYTWRHEHVEPQYPEVPADTFTFIDGKLYYRTYYCEESVFLEVPGSDQPQVCEM